MTTARFRLSLLLRAGYGAFLLSAPERLLAIGPGRAPSWAPGIARVLGARHVLQAALLTVRPALAPVGAAVDLAHASTDVLCAVALPEMRAPALLDTAVATALAWSTARR